MYDLRLHSWKWVVQNFSGMNILGFGMTDCDNEALLSTTMTHRLSVIVMWCLMWPSASGNRECAYRTHECVRCNAMSCTESLGWSVAWCAQRSQGWKSWGQQKLTQENGAGWWALQYEWLIRGTGLTTLGVSGIHPYTSAIQACCRSLTLCLAGSIAYASSNASSRLVQSSALYKTQHWTLCSLIPQAGLSTHHVLECASKITVVWLTSGYDDICETGFACLMRAWIEL